MTGHPVPSRHVVLLGLMGSGKTTVGRLVAERLGRPLRDSDEDIEAREGMSGRELRERRGTRALHALERDLLLEALASPVPSVVCAAASTVDDERCRDALRDPSLLVVWLTATPETAAARFDDQAHRPRYGADPRAFLAEQLAVRGPRFRSLGPVELATDDRSPEVLATTVVDLASGSG